MDELKRISNAINAKLEEIDDETLERIYQDHRIALEYVKKGAEKVLNRNLNGAEINQLACDMQVIAKMILKERKTN